MQDPQLTAAPEPTRFQCRHIHAAGRQCGSVCLRHEQFCYFHHTSRRPIRDARQRQGRRSTFELPLVEDRASIQAAIAQILCRIAANEVDPRRAGLLLYGLQIASINLPRQPEPAAGAPPQPTVEEVVEDPALGPIAPQTPYNPHAHTPQELTLEQILMREWAKDKELQQQDEADRQLLTNPTKPASIANIQASVPTQPTSAPSQPTSAPSLARPHPILRSQAPTPPPAPPAARRTAPAPLSPTRPHRVSFPPVPRTRPDGCQTSPAAALSLRHALAPRPRP